MRKIDRYNDYLLEKEFNSIVAEIFRIVENQTGPNTFEWDLTKEEPKKTFNFKDKEEFDLGDTIVFDMEQKKKLKDYINFVKNKASRFVDYIKEPDADLPSFDLPTGGLRDLLKKIVSNAPSKEEAMKKVKEYFDKFVSELKSLPYEIKKRLLKKFIGVFILFIPLTNLVTDLSIKQEPVLKEVVAEVNQVSNTQSEIAADITPEKETENIKSKSASFERAQHLVKTVEAGYSSDRKDTGNWIDVPGGGQRFIGTNHGISAPVLAQYFKEKGINRLISKQDMMDLKYETALEIYKKDYWDLAGLSNFKSQSIANVLYDECVNQGVGAALSDVKKSMENMGHETEQIGSWKEFHKELTPKVNNMSTKEKKELFNQIKAERLERYEAADTWEEHGDGWQNRLNDIAFEDGGENQSDVA
jgi:lysozyme family protein